MGINNTTLYRCVAKIIIDEVNAANGMKLCELVPKVFLQCGLVRSETECIVEQMIQDGLIKNLTYRNIDMDRWHAFLLTNKYWVQIYTTSLKGE